MIGNARRDIYTCNGAVCKGAHTYELYGRGERNLAEL